MRIYTAYWEIFTSTKFHRNASRPSRSSFYSFYFVEHEPFKPHPYQWLPRLFFSLNTCKPGTSQISQSKPTLTTTKQRAKLLQQWRSLSFLPEAMVRGHQVYRDIFQPGSFFLGFYFRGCKSIHKNHESLHPAKIFSYKLCTCLPTNHCEEHIYPNIFKIEWNAINLKII